MVNFGVWLVSSIGDGVLATQWVGMDFCLIPPNGASLLPPLRLRLL